MSDLFPLDVEQRGDLEQPELRPGVSTDRVDARDLPNQREGIDELLGGPDLTPGSRAASAAERYPVQVIPPLPTRPAAGRVVAAGTITLASTDTQPVLAGLDASLIQAQAVAYLLLRSDGVVAIAGARDAMPSSRASFGATGGAQVTLPHVGGVWVYPPATGTATVSWVVVGGVA